MAEFTAFDTCVREVGIIGAMGFGRGARGCLPYSEEHGKYEGWIYKFAAPSQYCGEIMEHTMSLRTDLKT